MTRPVDAPTPTLEDPDSLADEIRRLSQFVISLDGLWQRRDHGVTADVERQDRVERYLVLCRGRLAQVMATLAD